MKRSLAALFLVLLSSPVTAGDLYVVDSSAASMPVGSFAADDSRISLAKGETVTLIDAAGATRVIAGPFSGKVADGAAAAPGALSRIASTRADTEHVVGAIRAPNWDQ